MTPTADFNQKLISDPYTIFGHNKGLFDNNFKGTKDDLRNFDEIFASAKEKCTNPISLFDTSQSNKNGVQGLAPGEFHISTSKHSYQLKIMVSILIMRMHRILHNI